MCASALTRSIGRGDVEAWPHEERAPLIHWMADLRRENERRHLIRYTDTLIA